MRALSANSAVKGLIDVFDVVKLKGYLWRLPSNEV